MKLLRGIVQMPFKDRKNPGRYDLEGSDHDQEMLEDEDDLAGGKARNKQVKPYSVFNNTARMGNTALDRLRNMSKEDQQRMMNAMAHEYSFFGVKKTIELPEKQNKRNPLKNSPIKEASPIRKPRELAPLGSSKKVDAR